MELFWNGIDFIATQCYMYTLCLPFTEASCGDGKLDILIAHTKYH